MLLGPYPSAYIEYYINKSMSGVYILSRDGKTADYVGRSDFDLSSRIRESIKEGYGYTFFWFEYTNSDKEAYLKECEYYHKYNPRDNVNHPASPFGKNWRCPIIGCPYS